MPKEPGLPAITEDIIDDIVYDLANDVEFIVDAFMPDGKKFRQEHQTDDEAIDAYIKSGLRDNPEAAANFIRANVLKLTGKLTTYGIPPEMWAHAHPYDIAQAATIKLSYKMEEMIREREAKTAQIPPVSFPAEDEASDATGRIGY